MRQLAKRQETKSHAETGETGDNIQTDIRDKMRQIGRDKST